MSIAKSDLTTAVFEGVLMMNVDWILVCVTVEGIAKIDVIGQSQSGPTRPALARFHTLECVSLHLTVVGLIDKSTRFVSIVDEMTVSR